MFEICRTNLKTVTEVMECLVVEFTWQWRQMAEYHHVDYEDLSPYNYGVNT